MQGLGWKNVKSNDERKVGFKYFCLYTDDKQVYDETLKSLCECKTNKVR